MKIVTVKNLTLQYDNEDEVIKEQVDAFIDLLNETMSTMYTHSQPAIVKQDDTEIFVIDFEEDED
jgi:hypothetical protein